jgi:hypothetical protein
MSNLLAYFGEFPNPTRKVKKGNKGFHFLEDSLKLQLIILDKQGS